MTLTSDLDLAYIFFYIIVLTKAHRMMILVNGTMLFVIKGTATDGVILFFL